MARATGVQITGSTVRVANIDGSPKKFKIRGFGEAALSIDEDTDAEAALARAVKDAFKTSKASREHVILGIPIRDCVIREITIPFTDPEQIAKVIKFESEPHLHSCSIEDVVVGFYQVADHGSRSTVIVFAVKKDTIRRSLVALERAGVDPLSVDVDVAGLTAAVTALDTTSDVGTYLVCEIGYTSTLFALIHGGRLRAVRAARIGTDSITSRVSKDLDIDRAEARTRTQAIMTQDRELEDDLLIRSGDVVENDDETGKSATELERDIIRNRQQELVSRLEQEIRRFVNPIKLDSEGIERIVIVGPGANLPRMHSQLASHMQVPVTELDLLSSADHKFSQDEARVFNAVLPVATGLALKHIGHDPLNLEFRQEEFIFARKFDRLKVPLLCLVMLLTTLNGLWYFYESRRLEIDNQIFKQAGQVAADLFTEIADPAKMHPNVKAVIDYDDKELEKIFLGAGAREGRDRIDYIRARISAMHARLRDAYSLRQDRSSRRRGPRKRSSGGDDSIPDDVGDFVSALRRMEQVCKAVFDTNVREGIAINKLKATPSEVRLGLTVPERVETPQGVKGSFDILLMIKENLSKLPPEEKFKEMDTSGTPKPNAEGKGLDYATIVISFEKERK